LLTPGEDRVFVCNATVAGNSSVKLYWTQSDDLNLTSLTADHSFSVANITDDDVVAALCQSKSGAFSIPLQSYLASGSSTFAHPEGALLRHLQAALLICGAMTSLASTYSCTYTSSSDSSHIPVLTIAVSSTILPIVIATVVAAFVVVVVVIMACCCAGIFHSCRRKKKAALLMRRGTVLPHNNAVRNGVSNPTFDLYVSNAVGMESEACEFSRDKLKLISILGKWTFGTDWGTVLFVLVFE